MKRNPPIRRRLDLSREKIEMPYASITLHKVTCSVNGLVSIALLLCSDECFFGIGLRLSPKRHSNMFPGRRASRTPSLPPAFRVGAGAVSRFEFPSTHLAALTPESVFLNCVCANKLVRINASVSPKCVLPHHGFAKYTLPL